MHRRSGIRQFVLAGLAVGIATTGVLPAAGQLLNEDLKLTPINASEYDLLGYSTAIDNGIVAVGAINTDGTGSGSSSGSVYLFDAATGTQLLELLPDDDEPNDRFGHTVDINDGIVATCAWSMEGGSSYEGAGYLFDSTTGEQLLKFFINNDSGGVAVAIDDGIIAMGGHDPDTPTRNAAYLFDASTGDQLFKLKPSIEFADQSYGTSISIDGGIVAVGAHGENFETQNGEVYLYDTTTGGQLFRLGAHDGMEGDRFGFSVSIDNGIVAVGARRNDELGKDSGAVYLFDALTGEQTFKLLPEDGATYENFGHSVSINNGVVAVGAWISDDSGKGSGSAYLFDAATGEQIAKLLPSDGAANARFGTSISINNGIAAVGARLANTANGMESGSAYVFNVPSDDCLADINDDGMLSPTDFTAWINAFNNLLPECDQNGDGSCTPTDFTAWIANFNAGC
jgi:hypothetical protein